MSPRTAVQTRQGGSRVDLMERTVALVVTFSGLGNHRKVSTSQIEVDADKEWINVSKCLIDAKELEAINSFDGEIRRWLDTRALPSLLKKGIYLLPLPFLEEVNARLKEYSEGRARLVEKLAAVYESLIRDARGRLRDLFNPADYPSVEVMQDSFRLRWQYISFNTPANLEQINKEIYQEEVAKAQVAWNQANETIQQMLRAAMADLTKHMVDKLTPGTDGKKKVFKDSSVNKLQEFLATFDIRNVTDDAELKKLVDQAKALTRNVDPAILRSDEAVRKAVRVGFAKIQKAIEPMIVVQPRRAISFEEEV
jgi:hypothetical protein